MYYTYKVMDDFLLLKLNRVVWIAFLEQEKIEEGIRFFEMYLLNLEQLKVKKELRETIEDEINYSKAVFTIKISQLADKYYNAKDWANAVICYAANFKYKPDDVLTIRNFIETLGHLNQFDLEIDLLLHLEHNVNIKDVQMYKLLAELYSKRKDYQKAVEFINKYMEYQNDKTPSDYNLLGCYYNLLFSNTQKDITQAQLGLEAFEKASDMSVHTKLYAKNATIMAGKVGDQKAGRKFWDRILEIGSLTNDDKYDYAAFCLKNGDFAGWREYFEARFDKENNKTVFPKINKARWDGVKDLSNSTLLVYFEQGFGDTFLMFGYMPRLVKLAKHVIFVTQDAAYNLLKDNDFGVEVISSSNAGDLGKIHFDYYIPSMSIPVVMKMDRSNVSVGEGFIKSDESLVKEFKEKYFNNNKFKIGLSISGNATGDKTRDIDVNSLAALDKLENVEFYCLTKGVSDSKFENFKHHRVINLGAVFNDFSQTAAAIENCDLVISTDNCILNLSGGLGKKTFGLFNNPNQFRWFDLTGENTIWLTSVKPFLNDKFNDWGNTISRVIDEIEKIN